MNSSKQNRRYLPLLVIIALTGLLLLAVGPSTWAAPSQHGLRQTVPTRTPSKPPSPTPTDVPPTPTSPPTATPTKKPRPQSSPTAAKINPTQEPTPPQLPETGANLPQQITPVVLTVAALSILLLTALRIHALGHPHSE